MRRHTEEAVVGVFVVSKGMRSTCAECRSLCLQCLEHFSRGVCDGDGSFPEDFAPDVRIYLVVSEVLRANQDSFLECFPPTSEAGRRANALTKRTDQIFQWEQRFTIDETTTIDRSCYCCTRKLLHVQLNIMIARSSIQHPPLSLSGRAANAPLSLAFHPS